MTDLEKARTARPEATTPVTGRSRLDPEPVAAHYFIGERTPKANREFTRLLDDAKQVRLLDALWPEPVTGANP